jgi:membrane-bound ClpP family serine protease
MEAAPMNACRKTLVASLLLAAIALAAALASNAEAAVLKNKETGETIKGTLTKQKINKLTVFKLEGGDTKMINVAEWDILEADAEPAATASHTGATVVSVSASSAKGGEAKIVMIPIYGPIENYSMVEGVEKALADAKAKKPAVVIFHMNTPGGRVDLADKLIKLITSVDWATTAAWIEGPDKRALSAGAYLCLATHKIYMAPGATIGAATPYSIGFSGAPEINEKMVSAFRAQFRSLAQQRNHPVAIADAMVDRTVSAVQVWVDGTMKIVDADEATQMEAEHKSDGKFKRGKTVNYRGKLITLTDQEAKEFGLSADTVATIKDLAAKYGAEPTEVASADWVTKWVKDTADQRKAQVEKLRTGFLQYMEEASQSDPREQNYPVNPRTGAFDDGGARWRAYTDRALASLKKCAQVLVEVEKYAKDDRYDIPLDSEDINTLKVRMETFYKRLVNQRDARAAP